MCVYTYWYDAVPFSERDSEECDIWKYFIKGEIVGFLLYVLIYCVARAVLV